MKKRTLVVLAMILSIVLAACGGSTHKGAGSNSTGQSTSTTEGKPVDGGNLSIGLDAETNGWNPAASQWSAPSYYVAETIFDPLAAYNSAGNVEPFLAKTITHSADYKTWTIGLRPGVKFQNGQPLNAAAVVLQLTLCKQSGLVGQALLPMVNAVAVNPLTVQVNMSTPWVAFPAVLAGQPGFMAAPAQLKAPAAAAANKPIGTGAFSFVSWVPNATLVVKKNPNYWRTGLPHVNQITFRVITDPTARLQALQSGQIQFMYTAEASQIKTPPSGLQEELQHGQAPDFIMLNTDAAPLNNLDLRLALEYATNQQVINQAISLGIGSVATEPYAPGNRWYVPSGYPSSPNLTKAKQYIQDYLHQMHTSLPIKFTLGCTTVATYTQAMDLVQAQWQQIGVDVNLTTTEQATYIDNAVFGNYQANCWTQFGSEDPDIDATWWLSTNAHPDGQVALNFARLSDPITDHYLTIARETPVLSQRQADYGQVWKQFAQQAPYIWLGRAPDAIIYSPSVQGVNDAVLPSGDKALPVSAGSIVPVDQLWLSS
jgi:peptide/nickel transport system substrate-binding protein